MINYAVIGTGRITQSFISGCKLLNNKFLLSAIYSRSLLKGQSFANSNHCNTIYTDIEKLADDKNVDAVYIASPNAFHYQQSKLMLESGKNVICEKPITVTPYELEELQNLAFKKGLVYMEAIMGLHIPAFEIISSCIKKLGRISHARFDFSQYSSKYDSFKKGEHQNIFDPSMATGALMDLGIYCIYPAVCWFGIPNNIYCYGTKFPNGIDGEGGAIFRYPNLNVELTYSKTGAGYLGSEIIGEQGTIIIPSISKLTNAKFIDRQGNEKNLTKDMDKPSLMSYEADDFYNFIKDYDKFNEKITYSQRVALEVSKIMLEMRNQANIDFNIKVK